MGIFLALIHHPVLNRHGDVGTTAVTNVDLHDLARAGRTYGAERFFVVTPIELQQELVRRVIEHWVEGAGAKRVTSRAEAFSRVEVASSVDAAIERVEVLSGRRPLLAVTGAQLKERVTPWDEMRRQLSGEPDQPVLLLFGTGHGIAPEVMDRADIRLPALVGPGGLADYNHLSVRAAAVIVLDRLLGQ